MMRAYKHVALRLHALHSEDRRWMLDQMSLSDREALEPLLDELSELGIPRQMDAPIDVPTSPAGEHVEKTVADDGDDHIALIDGAHIRKLKALAQTELPDVFGVLMSVHPWSWIDSFLYGLPESVAGELRRVASAADGQLSIRFKRQLLETTASKLSEMPIADTERRQNEGNVIGAVGWKERLRRLIWRR